MNRLLLVFVKNPELGRVKTRLAKSIGDEAALTVYFRLLKRTRKVAQDVGCDVAVYYARFIDQEDEWDNDKFQKYVQEGPDIGARMSNAIRGGLQDYDQVCLVGGDIYDLSAEVINDGFSQLEKHDVVIGPAEDGGYYLIGMTKPNEEIFKLEQWSVPEVFDNTIGLIKKEGLTYATLKVLNDIDNIEDAKRTDLLQNL